MTVLDVSDPDIHPIGKIVKAPMVETEDLIRTHIRRELDTLLLNKHESILILDPRYRNHEYSRGYRRAMRAAFDASAIDPITPAMLPSLINATNMETEIPETDD
jgi:hypothetical protein